MKHKNKKKLKRLHTKMWIREKEEKKERFWPGKLPKKNMCTFLSWYISAGYTFKSKNLDKTNEWRKERKKNTHTTTTTTTDNSNNYVART